MSNGSLVILIYSSIDALALVTQIGYQAANQKIYELDPFPHSDDSDGDTADGDDEKYGVEDIQSLSDAVCVTDGNNRFPCCWRGSSRPVERAFQRALKEEDRRRVWEEQREQEEYDGIASDDQQKKLRRRREFREVRNPEADDEPTKMQLEWDGDSALLLQIRQLKQNGRKKQSNRVGYNSASSTNNGEKRHREKKQEIESKQSKKRLAPTMISSSKRQRTEAEESHSANDSLERSCFIDSEFVLYAPSAVDDEVEFVEAPVGLNQSLECLLTKRVAVAEPLAKVLKEHQREGIQFMW